MPRYLPVWLALVVAACGHNLVSTAPRALLAGTLLAPAMPGRAAAGLLADLPLPGIGRGADALVGHNAAGLRGVPGMPGVGGLAGVQALDEATASTVPVMRAPVLAIDAAGKPVPGAGAFTGPYGRFSIRGVPAGRHLLISSAYAVDREPQVQLALVAAEGGGADVVLDPAMSAATARALAAAGGHLEAIDPGRVAAAAKALRQEGARFSAADLGSAAALAGAYARAEAASAKVEQSDPGAGIPPALAAAGTATPLASPDYQDLVDMLANEGAAAFAPAPEASELAAALREAERPGDAQAGLPGGAPSTSAATGGEDPVAVAPGPDPATPSGPPAEAPGLAATPIGPAASPTPDVAPPAGPGSANPAIATPAPTPHPATPAPPVASPAPQVATPAPAAATPAPT
ncbi:MAG: hypothetical protein FJZ01_17130, partial [Candidatus Sericytochromatia bacterium]|nr:hypothetical protein [Candidatus Tanganyikabacteria bacterium]